MQAVDGPNSSQLEWHQIGVKTRPVGTLIADGSVFGGQVTCSAPEGLPLYTANSTVGLVICMGALVTSLYRP